MRTTKTLFLLSLLLLLAAPAALAQLVDGDGDGVEDAVDLCPAEDASLLDGDGDGCIDDFAGARHLEFWDPADLPLRYVIHENGAPILTDGSDFTAIQAGYTTWTLVPDTDLSVQYDGTTPQAAAAGLDGVHLVTFEDPDFVALYGSSVLAVGVTTSFIEPTFHDGRWVRPGQIVDADMIFNPNRTFSTPTGGIGLDLESVAVHEAGHLFGISHSSIESATMFPALPGGEAARTLESDDKTMIFMAYPDAGAAGSATVLEGTITDGANGMYIPGAAVFAIHEATGDTSACQYTLPDGSYRFAGLAPTNYFVAVHPLDGSAAIKGVTPGFINDLVDSTAVTVFVPEYWDANESAQDVSSDKTAISLQAGQTKTGVDIITNVDSVAPVVQELQPEANLTDVRIDALVLVSFDEPIDFDSAVSCFHFDKMTADGPISLGGSLTGLPGGKVLVFDPSELLDYDSSYQVRIDNGLKDRFGNETLDTLVSSFSTETQPAVTITSLSPIKGVPNSLVSVNGVGFEAVGDNNAVSFGGVIASLVSVSPTQIVARVPEGAVGDVSVTVSARGETSAPVLFTVLTEQETVRGNPFQAVQLTGLPRALDLLPDENFAYVGSDLGLEVVSLNASQADYMTVIATPTFAGGAVAVAATADGRRLYAVGRSPATFHVIDTDYGDLDDRSTLFNEVLDSVPMEEDPLGITIDPTGRRAYIPTAEGSIQIWDVQRSVIGGQTVNSLTLHRQVGNILAPGPTLEGSLAVDPMGEKLLVLSATGSVLVYSTEGEHPLLAEIGVGPDPRDLVIDATGVLTYVSDASGQVAVLDLSKLVKTSDFATGGSLRGIDISPAGGVAFAADRENDQLDLIDLNPANVTYRSVAGTVAAGENPTGLVATADGLFLYSLEQGPRRLAQTSIGFGPVLRALHRPYAAPGDVIALSGEGFTPRAVDQQLFIETSVVYFGETEVQPVRATTNMIEVVVPSGFEGGNVRARSIGTPPVVGLPDDPFSNPVFLPLSPPPRVGWIHGFATALSPDQGYHWGAGVHNVVEASPSGDIVLLVQDSSTLVFLDARPNSPSYHQELYELPTALGTLLDIVFSPDGKRAFVTGLGGSSVDIVDTDLLSPTFAQRLGEVDIGFGLTLSPTRMAVSPGGEELSFLSAEGVIGFVDLLEGPTQYQLVAVNQALEGRTLSDIAFHPGGRGLYVLDAIGQSGAVWTLSMDPAQPGYRNASQTRVVGYTPHAVAPSLEGDRLFVATANIVGVDAFRLLEYEVALPDSLGALTDSLTVDAVAVQPAGGLRVTPSGDRILVDTVSQLVTYDLTQLDLTELGRISVNGTGQVLGFDMVPDGSRLYTASFADTYPRVLIADRGEFLTASGQDQVGVAGEELPAPVRVSVRNGDLQPTVGLPVFVAVTEGMGSLDNGESSQIYTTDAQGRFEIHWKLGPEIAVDPQVPNQALFIDATNTGGLQVSATGLASPASLPLELAEILPSGMGTVSVSTAALATFSRPVDPASIASASLFLHPQGDPTPVPVAYGFADGGRKVSMTPLAPLDFSRVYVVEATAAILDADGGALQSPQSQNFQTQDPPALVVDSVSPPAATVGTQVVIAGEGFDAANPSSNLVSFGGVSTPALDSGVDFVRAVVPAGALTGDLIVTAQAQTSSAVPFSVLVPTDAPLDEVLGTVDTGATTRGVAITPDGLWAYSINSELNQVTPLDLTTLVTESPIAVGNQPVAIDIHPDQTYAYVANFVSGTVSVIDLATNTVSETIVVGGSPIDVLVAPDGQNVYVVNVGDQTVDVIDSNDQSGGFHSVVAKVPTGGTTKGAALSPDGSLLYIGTTDGFLIFSTDPETQGVTTRVPTGSGTKGAAITPDGSLLLLVTTDGEILVVDLSEGGNNAVVARVPAGGSTKGAAISPDGTLLYVIQEDSDEILVVQIEVLGSIGVLENPDGALPLRVLLTFLDPIDAGPDPVLVVFDPTGSGLTLVGNAGLEPKLTILNTSSVPFGQLEATLEITPRTLNLDSRGRWVHAHVLLPEGFSVRNIDPATVLLQGEIPADADRVDYCDCDQDGVEEVVYKFCRAAFQEVLPQGEYVPVELSGDLPAEGRSFVGYDTIRTIRPTVKHPKGGESLPQGAWIVVSWDSPQGVNVSAVDVHWTADDGENWTALVEGAPDTGEVAWELPLIPTDLARVLVTLYDGDGDDIGMGMSGSTFSIVEPAVPVAMGEVDVSLDAGAARLRWELADDYGLEGFRVLRGASEDGPFLPRTTEPLRSLTTAGRSYEFVDPDLEANRNYFYLLEEVRAGAAKGFSHGPYKLSYVLRSSLEQNFPNSFNPKTTIRFSLAESGKARLVIYDLAGRRVKVLVDGFLKADNYSFDWEGRDERGRPVASGVYLYRLQAEGFEASRKMVLVR